MRCEELMKRKVECVAPGDSVRRSDHVTAESTWKTGTIRIINVRACPRSCSQTRRIGAPFMNDSLKDDDWFYGLRFRVRRLCLAHLAAVRDIRHGAQLRPP